MPKTRRSKQTTKPTSSSSPSSRPSNPASTTPSSSNSKGTFYFHGPNRPGGFLSQWYRSPFTVDGITYENNEKWMMVQKAKLFNDEAAVRKMMGCDDPKELKRMGRLVKGFDGRVWDGAKRQIVHQGTLHKFTISEDAEQLRAELLATGDRELAEASPRDRVWGIGFGERAADAQRARWGENLLGKVLMDVRAELREREGEEG